MKEYDHKKIEKKWQKEWERKKIYRAQDNSKKPKYYSLIEFPYPSGDGLHVGHPRPYIGMDIISRKRRMEGFNVLYSIGWDAFGLPTENYAIRTGQDPRVVTKKNTDTFRHQIKSLGVSFDWSREINTTDPKYYKWTQWIFLQFLKKGLAYKTKMNINWCPSCKIGLANEEVVNGACERCGTAVEKREKEQWMLAITKYADRLYKDLDDVDYLPQIKLGQRNWIGRSEGASIKFKMSRFDLDIEVFTTRPDTLFGATYLVLAPEHELVQKLKSKITNWDEVLRYIMAVKNKTDAERIAENKEKTGAELKGIMAVNPATKEKIPIWIADYILMNYGTGAIMAVPAHDARDFEFAQEMKLEIIRVVVGPDGDTSPIIRKEQVQENAGKMINSSFLDGMDIHDATKKMMDQMEKLGMGKRTTTFKLRDWIFSRQRYWGEPIPVIHCQKCGLIPVPEKDLPVELPKVKNYQPTDSGESPLANIPKWVNVKCPRCKGPAKRETDTMPNWAGSSWYYLRYTDPHNAKVFASQKNLKYWLGSDVGLPRSELRSATGVDWYNGGNEHTTLHLLYSRFWHKFLFDLKLVPTKEPYAKRTAHGIILAAGGEKMSKSKGNVINPDDIVKRYGADTLRLYEMFMGPFDQAIAWSDEALIGPRRFLERVWNLALLCDKNSKRRGPPVFLSPRAKAQEFLVTEQGLLRLLHKTIKKVSEDIENMHFNTVISAMMVFVNEINKLDFVSQDVYEKFLKLLAPFAPHITEELWSNLGHRDSIHLSGWPEWDKDLIKDAEIKIAVQINGKVRAEIMIQADEKEAEVKKKAFLNQIVSKYISGKNPQKIIYIKNRLINIVL